MTFLAPTAVGRWENKKRQPRACNNHNKHQITNAAMHDEAMLNRLERRWHLPTYQRGNPRVTILTLAQRLGAESWPPLISATTRIQCTETHPRTMGSYMNKLELEKLTRENQTTQNSQYCPAEKKIKYWPKTQLAANQLLIFFNSSK